MEKLVDELVKLRFVCQSSGKNPQVKWICEGFESIVFASILFNKLKLSKNGVIYVFNTENEQLVGEIRKDKNDMPIRIKAKEKLFFKDLYIEATK